MRMAMATLGTMELLPSRVGSNGDAVRATLVLSSYLLSPYLGRSEKVNGPYRT